MSAKILFIDLETSPNLGYFWGAFNQDIGINQLVEEGYVLCWSAKWYKDKKIMSDAIWNYKEDFKKNPTKDHRIAHTLRELLNQADIVVAHNGINFDIRWLKWMFLKNNMKPCKPFKVVDTLKESEQFRCYSRKLDYLCKRLDLGKKLETHGFDLWPKAMKGDEKSCNHMLKYNKHDVTLVERLYVKLLPYMKTHPNVGIYTDDETPVCVNCGSENLKKDGKVRLTYGIYQAYQCNDCGKYSRGRENLTTKEKRKGLLGNV